MLNLRQLLIEACIDECASSKIFSPKPGVANHKSLATPSRGPRTPGAILEGRSLGGRARENANGHRENRRDGYSRPLPARSQRSDRCTLGTAAWPDPGGGTRNILE